MKHLTLFVLLVFCTGYTLWAQEIDEDVMMDNDVPGYIILSNGDTTKGKIKVSTRSKNQVRVKFTPQSKLKSATYKAKDKKLLGYGYQTLQNNNTGPDGQKVYKYRHFLIRKADQPPVPFSSSTVFMEVKALGSVNLYSYYVESNAQVESTYLHYYFMEAKFAENLDEMRERKVLREDYERTTISFMEDCPAVQNLIGSQLGYSNLDRIVIEYNKCEKEKLEPSVCDECAIEAARKKKEAERLKRIKEQQEIEQFKSSKRDKKEN